MSNKNTNLIALVLLIVMAITACLSMKQDALTFDELAHIPAGYSYLTKQDYRVNPEHPPLIKDIPGIPLLFLNLNFPDDHPTWIQEEAPQWWVQFDLGNQFLYHSGNNPRQIIFWSRFAMIVLLTLTGWLIFYWAKKIGGNIVALSTLAFFAFSPTFIAHGRLVNTDLGAVFGSLIAIFFWLKFLKAPGWKNIILAGISFGLAMLFKFSLILLIPLFVVITLLYSIWFSQKKDKVLKRTVKYSAKALLAALIGVVFVIWPIYQIHVLNYPLEQQLRDTIADISNHPVPIARDITFWMTEHQSTRGLAQYLRGLLMASQRTAWGNTAVFMEEISADSWIHYFPLLYLLKIPLAFHILSLFALLGMICAIRKRKIKRNFLAISFFIWIFIYSISALIGNLNIGIRHLLPIFPFIYILVSLGLVKLFSLIKSIKIKQSLLCFIVLLFVWYIASSLLAFPHYIPYYNELAKGSNHGYKIAVDSNYDWGQDFYRFLHFVEEKEIDKIYLDYFGGEDPAYWLKDKYINYDPKNPPASGLSQEWIAVSINQLMGGTANPTDDFDQETGYYNWLKDYTPVSRAGYSIFIYYID